MQMADVPSARRVAASMPLMVARHHILATETEYILRIRIFPTRTDGRQYSVSPAPTKGYTPSLNNKKYEFFVHCILYFSLLSIPSCGLRNKFFPTLYLFFSLLSQWSIHLCLLCAMLCVADF